VFFCNLLNRTPKRGGAAITRENVFDVYINNPAQLWITPAYKHHAPAQAIFQFLTRPSTNAPFIRKFNAGISKSLRREPIFPPRPGVNYIQEYLQAQYMAQRTSPLAYLQQWTFSNYEASMYAEVIQKGARYAVSQISFRQKLNHLLNHPIEHRKDAELDALAVDKTKKKGTTKTKKKGIMLA